MLKNNLKTALRFLNENKVFASINTLGLSIALAASFIILLFIINEFSYDRYHRNNKNIFRILYSFMFENAILVFIAAFLSVPITIYFMREWLNNFSDKVNISWWIFVITFAIATIIALLTVFYHSYRASRTNPINALRHE